ncbi:MAG: hypothetical protein H7233_04875 [Pseudorhodobacter sp.]|nr:hypothetical protein [Frankiaceae bacterium]
MTMPADDVWTAWLDGLQAWADRTAQSLGGRDLALPDPPTGGPAGPVPAGLLLRAHLVMAQLEAVEQQVARRRAQLAREHAYS